MLRHFLTLAPLSLAVACGPAPVPPKAPVTQTAQETPAEDPRAWLALVVADPSLQTAKIPLLNAESERLLSEELLAPNTDLGTFEGRADPLSFGLQLRALDRAEQLFRGAHHAELARLRADLAWEKAAPEALAPLLEAMAQFGQSADPRTSDPALRDRFLAKRLALFAAQMDARGIDKWDALAIEYALDRFDPLIDSGILPETARIVLALREQAEAAKKIPTGTRTNFLDMRIAASRPGENVGTVLRGLEQTLPEKTKEVRARLALAGPTKERELCTESGAILAKDLSFFLAPSNAEHSASSRDEQIAAILDHDRRGLALWALRVAIGRALLTDETREPVLLATVPPAARHRILAVVAADPLLVLTPLRETK